MRNSPDATAMPADLPSDVIVEFVRLGAVMRATAFDPATLVEAVVMGPAGAGEAVLEQAALAKLAYVLRRRASV